MRPIDDSRDVSVEGNEIMPLPCEGPDGVGLSHSNPLFQELLPVSEKPIGTFDRECVEEGPSGSVEGVVRRKRGRP